MPFLFQYDQRVVSFGRPDEPAISIRENGVWQIAPRGIGGEW